MPEVQASTVYIKNFGIRLAAVINFSLLSGRRGTECLFSSLLHLWTSRAVYLPHLITLIGSVFEAFAV